MFCVYCVLRKIVLHVVNSDVLGITNAECPNYLWVVGAIHS